MIIGIVVCREVVSGENRVRSKSETAVAVPNAAIDVMVQKG